MGSCWSGRVEPSQDDLEREEQEQDDGRDRNREQEQEEYGEEKQSRAAVSQILPSTTEEISTMYLSGSKLGAGASGVVLGCINIESGGRYACKMVDLERLKAYEMHHIKQELKIMAHLLGNPNVVQIYDVFESNRRLYIVEELCSRGSLQRGIGKLTEARAAPLFRGMINAVIQCHRMGVIHRDIKPDNFLLTSAGNSRGNLVKLTDFGLATFCIPGEKVFTSVGSPFYMAPEVIRNIGYGPEADTWSCGICLFQMLSNGRYPFFGSVKDFMSRIGDAQEVQFSGSIWWTVSADALDLLQRILCKDVANRIKIEDVLQHPWLQRHQARVLSPVVSVRPNRSKVRQKRAEFVKAFRAGVQVPFYGLLEAIDSRDIELHWRAMLAGFATLENLLIATPDMARQHERDTVLMHSILVRVDATLPLLRGTKTIREIASDMGWTNLSDWADCLLNEPETFDTAQYLHLVKRIYLCCEEDIK